MILLKYKLHHATLYILLLSHLQPFTSFTFHLQGKTQRPYDGPQNPTWPGPHYLSELMCNYSLPHSLTAATLASCCFFNTLNITCLLAFTLLVASAWNACSSDNFVANFLTSFMSVLVIYCCITNYSKIILLYHALHYFFISLIFQHITITFTYFLMFIVYGLPPAVGICKLTKDKDICFLYWFMQSA